MGYKDPEKQREYQREWQNERRAGNRAVARETRSKAKRDRIEKINSHKSGKPCMDCGGVFPVVAMDFDHVHGEKTLDISSMVRALTSWDRILEEIKKCELVCANCHRVRTATRAGWYDQRIVAQ